MARLLPCALLFAALALLGADGDDSPPAAPPTPPPATETSPEARALLEKAAARQGTADRVGEKAVKRFLAEFGRVKVHGENASGESSSVEAFALPGPGSTQALLRSEWTSGGKKQVLGHNGRFGWIWTEGAGIRRFTSADPEHDAQDRKDIDERRRMLRLALRVFFLGNLAADAVPVSLGPEEEKVFPRGSRGETWKVACRRIDRVEATGVGEPPLRLYIDRETLDPVAAHLLADAEGAPSWLLTFAFEKKDERRKEDLPAGVRVPFWLELFEVPADPKAPPAIRIQAALTRLEIDPAKVPDSLFAVPK